MSDKPTICVDLDGVLAIYDGWKGLEHIGEPFEHAKAFMAGLCLRFHVVVYTTRTNYRINLRPDHLKKKKVLANSGQADSGFSARQWARHLTVLVKRWLDKHHIPYHDIYDGNGKPMAAAFIDDRAVPCSGNPDEHEYSRMLAAATALALGVDGGNIRIPG